MDDERAALDPLLQLAIARFSERSRCKPDAFPVWFVELLEQYGFDCIMRGVKLAHERSTQRPPFGDDAVTPVVDLWKDSNR